MNRESIVLLSVMFLGVLGHNHLLVKAAALLLVVQVMGWAGLIAVFEKDGLELGILLLTVAVLAPLASGNTGLRDLASVVRSRAGFASLAAGMLAAVLTKHGVELLHTRPEVVVGLALGSIAGAAFLKGVPAGPLVAAGFAAVFIRLLGVR